ncbi:hypothetical protein ILYODFUR_009956 [Ilyodon furcidens]|uniref:Uncharacterized protein n=1 Tax=Ilyodon furcidens TaxID=33524 RepID=A0ABV0VFX4_9TELE
MDVNCSCSVLWPLNPNQTCRQRLKIGSAPLAVKYCSNRTNRSSVLEIIRFAVKWIFSSNNHDKKHQTTQQDVCKMPHYELHLPCFSLFTEVSTVCRNQNQTRVLHRVLFQHQSLLVSFEYINSNKLCNEHLLC